jgi:hypothetical protein
MAATVNTKIARLVIIPLLVSCSDSTPEALGKDYTPGAGESYQDVERLKINDLGNAFLYDEGVTNFEGGMAMWSKASG